MSDFSRQAHLRRGIDDDFSLLQAHDAIRWMEQEGVVFRRGARVLDLGAGRGFFGAAALKRGCELVYADETNLLAPEFTHVPFTSFDLEKDDFRQQGTYDIVVCSNVLEHLRNPSYFLHNFHHLLVPGGYLYLSFTNWFSPWGGHDFSPFHYFGPRLGPKLFDLFFKRERIHTPFVNLFPISIAYALRETGANKEAELIAKAPRYYTEAKFLMSVPIIREFLSWNCAILYRRKGGQGKGQSWVSP